MFRLPCTSYISTREVCSIDVRTATVWYTYASASIWTCSSAVGVDERGSKSCNLLYRPQERCTIAAEHVGGRISRHVRWDSRRSCRWGGSVLGRKIVPNCKCQPFQTCPTLFQSCPIHDFCLGSHDAYQDWGVGTGSGWQCSCCSGRASGICSFQGKAFSPCVWWHSCWIPRRALGGWSQVFRMDLENLWIIYQ